VGLIQRTKAPKDWLMGSHRPHYQSGMRQLTTRFPNVHTPGPKSAKGPKWYQMADVMGDFRPLEATARASAEIHQGTGASQHQARPDAMHEYEI